MSTDITLYNTVKCENCNHPQFYEEVYETGLTWNLTPMLIACGLYDAIKNPKDLKINKAGELLDNKSKYEKLNPENGYGSYIGLISMLEEYLSVCKQYPEASIEIS